MSDPSRASRIGRRLIILGIAIPVGIVLITLVSAIGAGTSADRGMGVGLLLLTFLVVGTPLMTLSAGIGTVLLSSALLRGNERRALKNVALCVIGGLLAAAGLVLTIAAAGRFVARG